MLRLNAYAKFFRREVPLQAEIRFPNNDIRVFSMPNRVGPVARSVVFGGPGYKSIVDIQKVRSDVAMWSLCSICGVILACIFGLMRAVSGVRCGSYNHWWRFGPIVFRYIAVNPMTVSTSKWACRASVATTSNKGFFLVNIVQGQNIDSSVMPATLSIQNWWGIESDVSLSL